MFREGAGVFLFIDEARESLTPILFLIDAMKNLLLETNKGSRKFASKKSIFRHWHALALVLWLKREHQSHRG